MIWLWGGLAVLAAVIIFLWLIYLKVESDLRD